MRRDLPTSGAFALVLSALVLAGCSDLEKTWQAIQQKTVSPASPVVAVPAPATPSLEEPADQEDEVAVAPPVAALASVNDDPDQFLGRDTDHVVASLGEPTQIRRDGGAEVWQYRRSNCVLDLFVYETNGARQVDYVELRNPGLTEDARRACLAGMLREALKESS